MRKDCDSMTSLTKKFALGNTHQPTDQKLFYTISIFPNALYATSVGSDHKTKSNDFIFCFGLVTRQKDILFSLFLFLTILQYWIRKIFALHSWLYLFWSTIRNVEKIEAKTQHSLVILTKYSNALLYRMHWTLLNISIYTYVCINEYLFTDIEKGLQRKTETRERTLFIAQCHNLALFIT